MKPSRALIFPISVFAFLFFTFPVFAQQSNFSISPPPVAWPYFDEGRSDLSIAGSIINMEAGDVSMTGGVATVKGRQALGSGVAVDVAAGFGGLGGTMPGIPPMSVIYTSGAYSYVPYYTEPTGKATISFLCMNAAADIEIQPIRSDSFGLILFGGFVYNYAQMTITSPYALIVPPPYSNAGTYFYGYQDTLTMTLMQYGYQFGAQIDLAASESFRLSPFFMMTSMQGDATMADNPGVSTASGTSLSAKIERTTSYAFGLDIIIGDVSIGTMLQQLQSASETNKDTRTIMISATYHVTDEGSSGGDGAK